MTANVPVPFALASEALHLELNRAWESSVPRLEALADSTASSWEQLVHTYNQAQRSRFVLDQSLVTFRESRSAVIEALDELCSEAMDIGEIEYLHAIAAESLATIMACVSREPPPSSLEQIHGVLSDREAIFLADREALIVALTLDRETRRRLRAARDRFARRRDELLETLRREPVYPSRRAA